MSNRMGRSLNPRRLHRVAIRSVEERDAIEAAALTLDPDEADPTLIVIPAPAIDLPEGVTLGATDHLTTHPTIKEPRS